MQIIQDFRTLHSIPELDNQLPQTLSFIRYRLAPLKCRVFSPVPNSLCAYFDYKKKSTTAFRADMDALPITEEADLPWKSRHTGIMHACGHDGHMAILLELARRIDRTGNLPCNVLLVFQPAEETTGGAKAICRTGIFQQLGVQYIFALHLWPGLEKGKLFSKPGFLMSRCAGLEVVFTGKGGHIAAPHPGCDALDACCRFYSSANYISSADSFVLKFGKLSGGTAGNILCKKAELSGSLRTYEEETEQSIRAALTNLCSQIAKQTGCRGEIFFQQGYPAVYNDPVVWKKTQKIYPVKLLDRALWAGEDFSYYQQAVSGVYVLPGVGETPPLHSPLFCFDESILSIGADFFEKLLCI